MKPVGEVHADGKTFSFCSDLCAARFRTDPKRFQGEPLIHLHDVWKVFGEGEAKTEVLRGINVHIWEGDFTAIIGASGSGKSTLLNMIGLLDTPTSGGLFLEGTPITKISDDDRAELRSKKFGFVFQQYNLVPWLDAYDNALLPLIFARNGDGGLRAQMRDRFREIGLGDRMDHRPYELSGGEQQRVALLRALANDPEIIIGDEPTGNLDSVTGNRILEMLIDLNKKEKKTLIIVTHDPHIAERADQIITIRDGKTIPGHRTHAKIYTQ
ncbi:ABC transporter ATP-binding protein [Patescibacteria group bacterium]|nr:ABC transporter ATP-binding protein [Patescibacteria group bacterium]